MKIFYQNLKITPVCKENSKLRKLKGTTCSANGQGQTDRQTDRQTATLNY